MHSTQPPLDQQVTWVYTEDLEGTAEFYASILGLSLVLDQGSCRIYRASPAAFIGVCAVRPGRYVEPKGVVITFVTQEVDEWHNRLIAAGATIDSPPEYSEQFMVYCFFVRDPNGYLLEFQRFEDPAWPND